jgi:hypothetical protein
MQNLGGWVVACASLLVACGLCGCSAPVEDAGSASEADVVLAGQQITITNVPRDAALAGLNGTYPQYSMVVTDPIGGGQTSTLIWSYPNDIISKAPATGVALNVVRQIKTSPTGSWKNDKVYTTKVMAGGVISWNAP